MSLSSKCSPDFGYWHFSDMPTEWVDVRVPGVNRTFVGHGILVAIDPTETSARQSAPPDLGQSGPSRTMTQPDKIPLTRGGYGAGIKDG